MPGMRDVARCAGVSLSTVSAVLNNSDKFVSEEIKQKVLVTAKELNYNLFDNKRVSVKTIAVILPIITSSFFSNILSGIEEILSKENILLLFYNSDYNFEKELNCLKNLRKNLAGVILDSLYPLDKEKEYLIWLEKEFISQHIPVLLLEREVEDKHFHCICIDNFKSAYMATQHLIDQGYKKIAHVSGSTFMLHSFDRLKGYKQALIDNGLQVEPELIQAGDFTPYSGYAAIKNILNIRSDFDALFSANDQMAIGAIKALRASGKMVPQDCGVVGFDNLSVSTLIMPALSTINVPTFQMGRLAAKIILNVDGGILEGSHINKLKTTLIIRRSSDIEAINEWELTGW